ncbi:ERF family protein [Methanosphaera sp.]|uniref:ERF family protein n=1 Tax=Methanosphaera sp. TaxID=2666342 RepID=UPI002600F01C|nr:ERF family protein [Methanosphaera sp.]
MGIDLKIEEAKNCFKEIQQSGRNNYQKYNYMEVKDIFPIVREVCKKFKMRSKFDWKPEQNIMELTLKDLEDGSTDVSTIPVAPVNVGDAGKYMQDIGRCQTYAQRYLYIQVFEIAVPDEIDNRNQQKTSTNNVPKKSSHKSPKKNTQYSPVQPVQEQHDNDEVTAERVTQIIDDAYNFIAEHTSEGEPVPFTWDKARRTIKRMCKNEQEYNACSQHVRFKTADKVNKT